MRAPRDPRRVVTFSLERVFMNMKYALTGLAWFLGYMVVTKLVIAPTAAKFSIPVLKDL